MSQRYRFEAEYLGSGFHGWQRQPAVVTVQSVLETAFRIALAQPVEVFAAGRTDSGVHAKQQSCHFDVSRSIDSAKLCRSVNALVRPHPVAIFNLLPVHSDFHARFSAIWRLYRYRILNRESGSPLRQHQVWHRSRRLDCQKMRMAAAHLIGTHDFSSFRGPYCQAASPVKTISAITIETFDDEIVISVTAPSFLHRQVRNIVGALVAVGEAKRTINWVPWLLGQQRRGAASITAPAAGLCLAAVGYRPEDLLVDR